MARKNKVFTDVDVVDIGDKGQAIGRTPDGRVVLVEGAVPGDLVTVRTIRKRKGMFITVPEIYQRLSEYRTEPFCKHFYECGGCKWQHLEYDRQLGLKHKAVKDALRKIGRIEDPDVEPIIGAEKQRFYRNKLEYTFTDERWLTETEIASGADFDRRGLGFHIPGQFSRVLDLSECHLQPDPSDAIRNFVREYALQKGLDFQNIRQRTGFLRNLLVRNNSKGEFMVAVIFRSDDPELRTPMLQAIAEQFPQVNSLYYAINEKVNDSIYDLDFILFHGEEKLSQTLGHLQFEIGPKSFFQTNAGQALHLYNTALDMAGLTGGETVFDLYCGIGSITMFLARQARFVVGVEENDAAIQDARANAVQNGIGNVAYYAGDARQVMAQPELAVYGSPEVVVTDPPRAGMHKDVVQSIIDLAPSRIVYVSCNPSTQARDIALLNENYAFVKARPVDMFPHTSHIENVALLTRKER